MGASPCRIWGTRGTLLQMLGEAVKEAHGAGGGGRGENGGVSAAPGSGSIIHAVWEDIPAHPPAYVGTEGFHFALNIFIALYQGELWARIWVGCGIKPLRPCQDPEHKVTPCATISSFCGEEWLLVSQEDVQEKQAFTGLPQAQSGHHRAQSAAHHPQHYL